MEGLSPLCIIVINSGELEGVERYLDAVKVFPDDQLVEYQKHVLFPLLHRLKNGLRAERVDSIVLTTLNQVLSRLEHRFRDSESLATILLTLLTYFCSPEGGFQSHVSEDLQLRFAEVVGTIFTNLDTTLIVEIYADPKYQVVVAPLVKALVDLICHRSKTLKLLAMRSLRAIYAHNDIVVVRAMSAFLPGIAGSLLRQVMDFSEKSGPIFDAALETFTDSVRFVMNDDVDLGERFYDKSVPHVVTCISTLRRVTCPPHFTECEIMCRYFATEILGSCASHLNDGVPFCLEILLTLEDPRTLSLDKLASLIRESKGNIILTEKLRESFERVLIRMPRICAVGLDAEKNSLIRQIHGLLRIHPETILKTMENEVSRRKFLTSLLRIAALDYTTLRITPAEQPNPEEISALHKQMKFLHADGLAELRSFCYTFGTHLNLPTCQDLVLELVALPRWHTEAILVLSFIIKGLQTQEASGYELIDHIINTFPNEDTIASILQRAFSLMLVRQLIPKVKPLTIRLVSFLLAKQDDTVDICAVCAEQALFQVPNAMRLSNLEQLLIRKSEEIIDDLQTLIIEDTTMFYQACRTLLTYIPEQAMDLYMPLFTTLISHLTVGDCQETLSLLHQLVRCLQTRCPQPALPIVEREQGRERSNGTLQEYATQLLCEMQADHEADAEIDKKIEGDLNPEDMLKSPDEVGEEDANLYTQKEDEEAKKAEVPNSVKLCVDILDACVNMQSGSLFVHTKAFDILADGVGYIEIYEDELLPMIHLIWEALVHRLKCLENFALSTKALVLLSVLCRTSRTFVRDRIIKELWVKFTHFLNNQRRISSSTPFREYQYFYVYKYQLTLIECLGTFAVDLELREEHLSPVLAAVLPYLLDSRQPRELHKVASDSVHKMASQSPECVRYNLRKVILDGRNEQCPWCDLRLKDKPDPASLEEFPAITAAWI